MHKHFPRVTKKKGGCSSVFGDIRLENFYKFKIVGALRPCPLYDWWSSGGSFRPIESREFPG